MPSYDFAVSFHKHQGNNKKKKKNQNIHNLYLKKMLLQLKTTR